MNQPHSSIDASHGRDLGKYRIIARLARGGMGEVYLAAIRGPAGFNKVVVVKELRQDSAEDPHFLQMFLDEARLAARLNHPNVVQTNEVGCEGGRYFIAMEYLDGQTLQRVRNAFTRKGGLPLRVHLRILADVLQGLHYAHELADFDGTPLGVVHRDVSPQNVFVTYDGQVKVVDFGIAKALDSQETRTGMIKGKAAYMAPEQAQGLRVDRRADVYSAGVMLWEALTGQRMWKGLGDVTVLLKLISEPVASPRSVRADVPDELERICMKALARDPDERYATAALFRADLERWIKERETPVFAEQVGELVSAQFAEDRARIRGLIEASVRQARGTSTDDYMAVELVKIDADEVLSKPSTTPPPRTAADPLPIASAPPSSMSGTVPATVRSSVLPGAASAPETSTGSEGAREVPRRRAIVGLLAAGVAVAAVVGALALRSSGAPPVSASKVGEAPSGALAAEAATSAPNVATATPEPALPPAPPATAVGSAVEHAPATGTAAHAAGRAFAAPARKETPVARSAVARAAEVSAADPPAPVVAPEPTPAPSPPPAAAPVAIAPAPAPASTAPRVLAFRAEMGRPRFLSGQDPVYPREARLAGVQGTTVAKCIITTAGTLDGCRIVKSLPYMDGPVLDALRTRRYTPLTFEGQPVAVEYVFNVQIVPPPAER